MREILVVSVILLSTLATASEPNPILPQITIDTTFTLPTGGQTWTPLTGADLQNALTNSAPGDIILLTPGAVYSLQSLGRHFHYPQKANPNNQWIYLASSPYVTQTTCPVSPPGTRVNPAKEEVCMGQIVAYDVNTALMLDPGANYLRIVGVEIYTTSTHGEDPNHTPWPINGWTYNLITGQELNNITLDRVYIHGSDAEDIQEGFETYDGSTYIAVVDSEISDIHLYAVESQAFLTYASLGPFKLDNNRLSASGENLMFGGAGAHQPPPYNTQVPSDITITNNLLDHPLSWIQYTTGAKPYKWVLKNNAECKSCQRVLFDQNTIQNNWQSGQGGAAVVLTPRTSQSGNTAVVDNITFSNNILQNVVSGFSTISGDNACGTPQYPDCTNPGESKEVKIYNNLITFWDPTLTGGSANIGIGFAGGCPTWSTCSGPFNYDGTTDWVFQHNTMVAANNNSPDDCKFSIYFSLPANTRWPPKGSATHNVWILDNALCRQPIGDDGAQGTKGLDNNSDDGLKGYMADPSSVGPRFFGNIMFVPNGNTVQTWPASNLATTTAFTFDSYGDVLTPVWNGNNTSDGAQAGYNYPQ